MEIKMPNQSVFVAFDGDGIGSLVGRAVLADDVAGIKHISALIQAGQDAVAAWATSYNAQPISHGGDESSYEIPTQALETLEQARKDYEYATGGMTCTAGVGAKLSEAGKALMVGKLRGKNLICTYDQSVEQEYHQAEEDTANGTATGEAAKLGHAYMQKDPDMKTESVQTPAEDSHADCPYCEELSSQQDSDPDHCESCHDEGDDCPYCAESDEDAEHDPSSDDHTDDCPYCADADAPVANEPEVETDSAPVPTMEDQPEPAAPITDDASEHTQGGMGQILDQIVAEDGESTSVPGIDSTDVDDAKQPIAGSMEGNVSRPPGYGESTPGDMGLDQQQDLEADEPEQEMAPAPDFGSVLKDGLEDHADAIQKERVMSMVAEALQGFKANKSSLDQAKEQVPGLYQSSIAMLKAMIEMAKLLKLEGSPTPGGNIPQGSASVSTPGNPMPEEEQVMGDSQPPKQQGQ
jgi:hypothetical protein